VDLLSLSAHKFYGPKGVGVFYVRSGLEKRILWQQQGGSQEKKRRAGTENVPYIAGTAKALTLAEANRAEYVEHTRRLRDRLLQGIQQDIPGVILNGSYERSQRLANNINVSFEGIQEEGIIQALDLQGIAASNGSACNVGAIEPSHVIQAIGGGTELALGTLRLTLGKSTTEADVDYVLERLPDVVKRMRALSELTV
jgi:cysteine desulfurase